MSKILFKDLIVEHIVKKSLKHSYIRVDKNSNIIVKTPKSSTAFVENLLLEKEMWIRKQLVKIEAKPIIKISLEDEVMLYGEIYSIDSKEVSYLRDLLNNIKIKDDTKVLKSYDKFYLSISKEYLTSRVEYYSTLMSLTFSELKFRKMKSRWGSCNSNRVITLNTNLMKVKKEYIDYVVVHELAHLVHMNHSREFHNLVDIYIQNSKIIRKEFHNTSYL